MDTVQKNYRFPDEMAEQLSKLCDREFLNEAAFVRAAVAEKMEEYGIVVAHQVTRGNKDWWKKKTNKP